MLRFALAVVAVVWLCACRIEIGAPATRTAPAPSTARPAGRVVLYTSAYREVTDALQALVKAQLPDVDLIVFQGGSEKVAGRLDADLAAGRAGCDVLLVSDPFLYRRLKREGRLLPHVSPFATPIDRSLVDVDNTFVAARASTMVVAFHERRVTAAEIPRTLRALLIDGAVPPADVAFGDPLSSGTAFMTAVVVGNGDVSFLAPLKRGGAAIGGGNSVVLQRVLSGERRVGVVLLENVLAARARGEPVGFVIPDDAVVIPGDVAILKDSANPTAAVAVVDVILSPAGQELMRGDAGGMHAPDPRLPPPRDPRADAGGVAVPSLSTLLARRAIDDALLEQVSRSRGEVLSQIERALLDAGGEQP